MTCDVVTIDSNVTGLAFAEEECLNQLPGVAGANAVWYGLEPNSYADFGADIKTVARRPINALRKNKKGSVVGLTAQGGFNQDFTQTNTIRLMQTFFFAAARQKPSTHPMNGTAVPLTSVATSDDSYNAATGLSVFLAGHVVKVTGLADEANNVVTRVVTTAAGKITVSDNLVNEAAPPAAAKIDAVGFQFGVGGVALTVSAALATFTIAGVVAASGVYTLSAQPADGDTVTIGSKVYTFKTALSTGPTVANEVLRGAATANSLANLTAAINGAAGAGTTYSTGTVANTQVTAAVAGSTVVVTAKVGGATGNTIATTEAGANSSWGAATLASGAGVGWVELGIIRGEWVGIGGDDVLTRYSTSTNTAGYGRVHTVTDSVLTLNDATWTPVAEPGAAKTIRVFFGTMLRDEDVRALITKRYVQFEHTLGQDGAGDQAEYLTGAIGNELTFNIPLEDKLHIDLSFVAAGSEIRDGTQGLKVGTRVNAPGESAYNSSSDVYLTKMNVLDPDTLSPSALFGFIDSGTLTIKNSASSVKAVGSLSAIDTAAGNFSGGGDVSAFFTEITAVRSVRQNADVAISMIFARANAGFVFDLPLVALGGGRAKIEPDKPIMLSLTMEAGESVYGHQLAFVSFPYLPTVLMPAVS